MNDDNRNRDGGEQGDELTTVFFSYSRVDQAKALPIIQAIEDAGYKVWWDGMLEVGTNFLETTEEALESAKAVVVLWSETSISSHWVRDEATSGRIRDRLVPLSLDGSQAPLGFRQVQIIDMQNWSGRHDGPAMEQIKNVLAQYHGTVVMPVSTATTIKPVRRMSRRTLMVSSAGAASLVLVGGYAMKTLLIGAPKISRNSLAVMPFTNLSNDSELNYLASGLASEIRTTLARNEALKVAARLSSEAISKQSLGAAEISKKLDVGHIIVGQIEKIANNLRVTTELIDGKSGFTADIKVFEHSYENAIRFRDEIAKSISNLLTIKLSDNAFAANTGATQNAAAFNEYLKGMDIFLSNRGIEAAKTASSHIETALEFDPKFGAAHSAKARMLLYLGGTAKDADIAQNYFGQATTTAQKAVRLSPELAEAHVTLGNILFSANLDLKGAREPYITARNLGAGDASILGRYASYMAVIGHHDEARDAISQALELDPLNLTMRRISGLVSYSARRFEDAVTDYEYIIATDENYWGAKARLGQTLIFMGQIEQGLAACASERNDLERMPCQAIGLAKLGNQEGAQKALTDLIETYGDAGAYQQAQILSQWGELDHAMDVLEFASEIGDSGLTFAFTDPALDPLRPRPRFKALLEKIGFLE